MIDRMHRSAMAEKNAIVGLGYVGLPVPSAFADKFPDTVGFDINDTRIAISDTSTSCNPGCTSSYEAATPDETDGFLAARGFPEARVKS